MHEKNSFLFFNLKTIFNLELSLTQSIELRPWKENINIDVLMYILFFYFSSSSSKDRLR